MFDDIAYRPEADQRPESISALRRLPASSRVDHPALKAALVAYEQARKDELSTRQDFHQLEIERDAAAYRDEVALPMPAPRAARIRGRHI